MRGWISARLSRKVTFVTTAGLVVGSVGFLVLFVAMYQNQLAQERSRASLQVNQLLQASLENAMLKRDLDGLRMIVAQLGAQRDIQQVMIVDPAGEVRFASAPEMQGHQFSRASDASCSGCLVNGEDSASATAFMTNERGHEVLRSVNTVRNRAPCTGCHGDVENNPVNGVLFVDFDAEPLRQKALESAVLFSGAGGIVILIAMLSVWWALRRFVLAPVAGLSSASRALAEGHLDARVAASGHDELAQLGRTFNEMAANLQSSLRKVRRNEAFLQQLIDAVPDGIRLVADDFSIVMANRAYCRQMGTTLGATVGSPCYRSSHRRAEPCCPTLVKCPLVEIGKGGHALKCLHQHVRDDGSDFMVEVVAAPLPIGGNGNEKTLVVESIRDLSQAVQYSHEQRLAELAQLAAGIAHEIHNPLASIRLSVQAMLRDAGSDDLSHATLLDYLAVADGEIENCIEISERLLRLSAPPSSHPELLMVNRVITDTLALLDYEAEQTGIAVHRYLHPSEPRVIMADSDLRTVVLNLAQNAFHAMPGGGCLRVASIERCGEVVISFEDSGVGIAPEVFPRIYEPFYTRRADGVRGTGLGLSISKAIIERQGGSLGVRTRVGEGTCFTVTLASAERLVHAQSVMSQEE